VQARRPTRTSASGRRRAPPRHGRERAHARVGRQGAGRQRDL